MEKEKYERQKIVNLDYAKSHGNGMYSLRNEGYNSKWFTLYKDGKAIHNQCKNVKVFDDGHYKIAVKNGFTSIYRKDGKILKDNIKEGDCRSDIKVEVDHLGNFAIIRDRGDSAVIYDNEGNVTANIDNDFMNDKIKIFNGLCAIKKYAESNKERSIHGEFNCNIYDKNKKILFDNIDDWQSNKNSYAIKKNNLWTLYNNNNEIIEENIKGLKLFDNGLKGKITDNNSIDIYDEKGNIIDNDVSYNSWCGLAGIYITDSVFCLEKLGMGTVYNEEKEIIAIGKSKDIMIYNKHYAKKIDKTWYLYDSSKELVYVSEKKIKDVLTEGKYIIGTDIANRNKFIEITNMEMHKQQLRKLDLEINNKEIKQEKADVKLLEDYEELMKKGINKLKDKEIPILKNMLEMRVELEKSSQVIMKDTNKKRENYFWEEENYSIPKTWNNNQTKKAENLLKANNVCKILGKESVNNLKEKIEIRHLLEKAYQFDIEDKESQIQDPEL